MPISDRNPIRDPNYGFAMRKPRSHPPIEDVSPQEWTRRTQTRNYIRRIKRSVQSVNSYLLLVRGWARGASGHQVDACHYFSDVSTYDSHRRDRKDRTPSVVAPGKDVLADSLKY